MNMPIQSVMLGYWLSSVGFFVNRVVAQEQTFGCLTTSIPPHRKLKTLEKTLLIWLTWSAVTFAFIKLFWILVLLTN